MLYCKMYSSQRECECRHSKFKVLFALGKIITAVTKMPTMYFVLELLLYFVLRASYYTDKVPGTKFY